MNVIAFSLYGTDEAYRTGAVENAKAALQYFPGWICHYYISQEIPNEVIEQLRSCTNVIVHLRTRKSISDGAFWRFEAAALLGVKACIFRDVDSRLDARDYGMVSEWIGSKKKFHIIRDHPNHDVPMMAGMWGVMGGIAEINVLIGEWARWQKMTFRACYTRRSADEGFLESVIYPHAIDSLLVHSRFTQFVVEKNVRDTPEITNSNFIGRRLCRPEDEGDLLKLKDTYEFIGGKTELPVYGIKKYCRHLYILQFLKRKLI